MYNVMFVLSVLKISLLISLMMSGIISIYALILITLVDALVYMMPIEKVVYEIIIPLLLFGSIIYFITGTIVVLLMSLSITINYICCKLELL